jgi:hypothetical protein
MRKMTRLDGIPGLFQIKERSAMTLPMFAFFMILTILFAAQNHLVPIPLYYRVPKSVDIFTSSNAFPTFIKAVLDTNLKLSPYNLIETLLSPGAVIKTAS